MVPLLKKKKYQEIFLVLISLALYFYLGTYNTLILLFSILFNFFIGKLIFSKKNKIYLISGITVNVLLLVFFKYTDFIIQAINGIVGRNIPLIYLILPVGISFYTFRVLSYLIDIYMKKIKPVNSILDFALYVSFFPYILAGPITRATDFFPQLKKIKISEHDFKAGITLIAAGLVKKLVFADNIAVFANDFLNNPNAFSGALFLGVISFGIQLYCDFSGYSDIAIGIAKLFGFKLGFNFDYPYFAKDISTFWRKWHITLSSWLRDYIYIPLGGNRKGKFKTYLNLIITMIIGGLWHGASWTFVIWGIYFGGMLAIHKILKDIGITHILNFFGKARNTISLLITQAFVFFGWVFFSAKTISNMVYTIKNLFVFTSPSLTFIMTKYYIPLLFLFLFFILHIFTYLNKDLLLKIEKADLFYWSLFLFLVFLALFFLTPGETSQFIYSQF
jgi:alginate O-acetyltransferase complex protein AlgI